MMTSDVPSRFRRQPKAKRSGLTIHQQIADELRTAYNNRLTRAKSQHFLKQISEARNDSKAVQKLLNRAMHNEHQAKHPCHDNPSLLANQFSDFFMAKMNKIVLHTSGHAYFQLARSSSKALSIRLASLDEIKKSFTSHLAKVMALTQFQCGS